MFSVRSLLLIAVIWFIIFAIKRWRKPDRPSRQAQGQDTPMVRCQHCGVYVPKSEASLNDTGSYCSLEHLNQGHGK